MLVPGRFYDTGLLGRPWRPSVARTASSLEWSIGTQDERFSRTICTNLLRPGRLRKCSTYQSVCLELFATARTSRSWHISFARIAHLGLGVCDHAVWASGGLLRNRKNQAGRASRGVPGSDIVRGALRRWVVVPAQCRAPHVPRVRAFLSGARDGRWRRSTAVERTARRPEVTSRWRNGGFRARHVFWMNYRRERRGRRAEERSIDPGAHRRHRRVRLPLD